MTTQTIAPWWPVLDRQDRVISRRQARDAGMTEDAWQWHLDAGRWRLLLRGVAVGHSGPSTCRQRAWAAVLSAGEGGVLTADGALGELGLDVDVTGYDVGIPEHREVRRKRFRNSPVEPGSHLVVEAHRLPVRALACAPGALPVVPLEVALLHAAEWAPSARSAEWRLAAAVQQGLTTPARVRSALASAAIEARTALVTTVLSEVELGAHARSELDFLAFLRERGLPLPDRLQRPVRVDGKRYLDAWWERQRVGAEVDGGHHRLAASWDSDTLRANDVVLAERHARMLLLRLTTGNLRHDRSRLARQFATALR